MNGSQKEATMQPSGRTARYLLTMLAGLLLVFAADFLGLFEVINRQTYDFFSRLRTPGEPDSRVVIAAIDEKTLTRLGRWPLRRLHYARMLDATREADVVGFNIIMAEPSGDDDALAGAIRRHGGVVLPVYLSGQMNKVYPVQTLSRAATGHIHVEQDVDGVVRGIFHTLYFKDAVLPSMASVIYETATDAKLDRAMPPKAPTPGNSGVIYQSDPMRINYYAPGAIQSVSVADIIEGVYPPSYFRNKIVLAGVTAAGIEDRPLTPVARSRNKTPGVELQATILSNLLDGRYITDAAPWARWLSALATSALLFALFMKISEKSAALLWAGSLVAAAVSAYFMLTLANLWLAPALLYVSITFAFIMAYIFKLHEAALRLDEEYANVVTHLRGTPDTVEVAQPAKGLAGFLSAGGISAKVRTLTRLTGQVLFEKALTDAVLRSEIHGCMLFDRQGRMIMANNSALEIHSSLKKQVRTIGDFTQAVSEHMVEKKDLVGSGLSPYEIIGFTPFTILLPAPQNSYLKLDSSRIPFNGGEYLVVTMTDITQVKKMEILKGQVVSMVSHELKQPLTGIMGYADLLEHTMTGPEKEYAGIIARESNRMNRFINAFLNITNLESGTLEIARTPVNVADAIHYVADFIKPSAREKGIKIRTEIPADVSLLLLDPDLTTQCILNLTENAIKYSPPESEVVITCRQEAGELKIEVIDHGIGIDEAELGRIFERFYRGRPAGVQQAKGSGLGLAFVKEAIERQGGGISVKSVIGEGSTFTISFPRLVAEPELAGTSR